MITIKEDVQLTIAIPTYNRPERLKRTLNTLLPQLNDRCFLRILDNCSDLNVSGYAEKLIEKYGITQYEIIRNKVNIGGDSNIVRCFELCETEWLWTLGDDDEIMPDAIATILRDINNYAEVVNINYYTPHRFHPERLNSKKVFGKTGFVSAIDSFNAVIFISANVYNMNLIGRNLYQASHNTYSCASQWLVIYYALDDKSPVLYSNQVICNNTFSSDQFSSFNLTVAKGFSTIIDIAENKALRLQVIKKLKTATYKWITIDGIIKALLIEYYRSNKQLDILFKFKRLYNIFYKYFGLKTSIKYYFYLSFLAISPSFCMYIVRKTYLFIKKQDIYKFIK